MSTLPLLVLRTRRITSLGGLSTSRPSFRASSCPGRSPRIILCNYLLFEESEADAFSPEYHPGNETPDLSLYIYDPRETFLRKSRSSQHPPHFRRSNPSTSTSSSPLLMPSPELSGPSHQANPPQEVWTGKGLVSWALNEPGVGKNLVTGKLVRRREYTRITTTSTLSPLEALMASHKNGCEEEVESWGIEVSLGLKHGAGGQIGFRPQLQHAHTISTVSRPPSPQPIASTSTPAPQPSMPARHSYPAVPRRPGMPATSRTAPNVPVPARQGPSSTPARPVTVARPTKAATASKARPAPTPRQLATVDTNSRRIASTSKPTPAPGSRDLPFEIPRHVYDNPDLLTKEQAERLIASPFFLDKLSEMTGHPLVPKVKREREEDGASSTGHSAKKSRKSDGDREQTKCYNCGRTKSFVWRQLAMDDNNTVTICNGESCHCH
jgi:hypothetical protein